MTTVNLLDTFNLPDPIFIDANIFLFHAFAHPKHSDPSCRFLERVERKSVNAVTSVLVVNEVLFKIGQQGAASYTVHPTIWAIRDALRQDPAFAERIYRPVREYAAYLRTLMARGLTILDVTSVKTFHAVELGRQHGLLITDATHVAVMEAHRIGHLATDDKDLWDVPFLTAWRP